MSIIVSCVQNSQKKKYIRFVSEIYEDDPSYVGTSLFELETYLYQKSRHAREVFNEAILIETNGDVKLVCMFFRHTDLPLLQIGFFEARKNVGDEVKALVAYAETKAIMLGLKKVVVGLNAHVSIGVGMLTSKVEDGPIAFNSIYTKHYYADYFKKLDLTESSLSIYKGHTKDVLNLINNRAIDYQDVEVRPLDKQNFKAEMKLMTKLSNKALRGTELFYDIQEDDLFERLKNLKYFLKPYDLLFVLKNGREIGYLFTHPDYNQIIPSGKKISKLSFALQVVFKRKQIDTLKVNSVCMTEKRSVGLQHVIKVRTTQALKDGHQFLESNFIFDSNRLSSLFALKQGYEKHNSYSIFYKEVVDA